MEGDIQIVDLDEALFVISLKNDEINNLKSSIKTIEKKNSIKISDLQFKIDQQKSKHAEVERKSIKSGGQLDEQIRSLREENSKLTQTINELKSHQRSKQRQFKGMLFQQKIKFERQKQNSFKLSNQLQFLHRHFDPKKILSLTKAKKIQQIPSYIELYQKNIEKGQQIQQLNLQMDKLRSQTIQGMQQSFKKLTSYEAVMQNLDSRNRQLQEEIRQREHSIELHNLQLIEKKQLLESVKQEVSQKFDDLNQEIHTLQKYIQKGGSQQQPQMQDQQYFHYQNMIQQLEKEVQQSHNQNKILQNQYQERIAFLNEENLNLKRQLQETLTQFLTEKEYLQSDNSNLIQLIQQKDDQIIVMSTFVREQQEQFLHKRQQMQRQMSNVHDLLRKKKKAQQEYRQGQTKYKQQLQLLSQEVNHLKNQIYNRQRQSEGAEFHQIEQFDQRSMKSLKRARSGFASLFSRQEHHNLYADIKQNHQSIQDDQLSRMDIGNYEAEPDWSELYYNLLAKHNQFAKKVQTRLFALNEKMTQ